MTKQTETLQIQGMSCGHCVTAVRQALAETEGVEVHEVEIGSARISYDPADVSRQQLADVLDDAGYTLQ